MTEYSDEDAQYANFLMSLLLETAPFSGELEENLVISDVEKETADFLSDLEFLQEIGSSVPVMAFKSEELVPIDLELIFGRSLLGAFYRSFNRSRYRSGHPLFSLWPHYTRRELNDILTMRLGEFKFIDLEEARLIFKKRAIEFLTTRVATTRRLRQGDMLPENTEMGSLFMAQFFRGPRVFTPGCNFTVTTNSKGLRVFWSGAYRISSNYFSHPTTPTSSVLQSGNYIFGVDGGAYGNTIQWDTSAVVSLPGKANVHLQY